MLAYSVRATIPTEPLADRFVAWLEGGHLAGVLAGGADRAEVLRLHPDPGASGVVIEVRYRFPSREAFETYERDSAPALRAEGIERFGPDTGIVMERSVGAIIAESQA
ncbi:MAG: DUF4286 family protein [Phycisphaerales bacterium]